MQANQITYRTRKVFEQKLDAFYAHNTPTLDLLAMQEEEEQENEQVEDVDVEIDDLRNKREGSQTKMKQAAQNFIKRDNNKSPVYKTYVTLINKGFERDCY